MCDLGVSGNCLWYVGRQGDISLFDGRVLVMHARDLQVGEVKGGETKAKGFILELNLVLVSLTTRSYS